MGLLFEMCSGVPQTQKGSFQSNNNDSKYNGCGKEVVKESHIPYILQKKVCYY